MSNRTHACALPHVQAAAYTPHPLHGEQQVWVEKNCYTDVWIELLHALGLEPTAMLGYTLAVDFEDDQWTFFKPSSSELRQLYGVDVQELTVWRPLADHALEHLAQGRLISAEASSFWLPDTAGTDYRRTHAKTTIVINEVDLLAQRMGYFHNTGYHVLSGEDFRQLMRIDAPPDPTFMPLFAERVRVDRMHPRSHAELRGLAQALLREHLAARPTHNPVQRFAQRLAQDMPLLLSQGLTHYHAWAFATLRQCGAAFDLASAHLRWLDGTAHSPAAQAFDVISQGCKTLVLKLARAVNAQRPFDATPLMSEMAHAWDSGMTQLDATPFE